MDQSPQTSLSWYNKGPWGGRSVSAFCSPGPPHHTPPFLTIIKYHLSSSITYQLIQWYSDTMIQITVSLSNSITISVDQLISDISSVIKYHLSVDTVIQWYSDTVIQWYSDAVIQIKIYTEIESMILLIYHLSSSITCQLIQWYSDIVIQQWYSDTAVIQWCSDTVIQIEIYAQIESMILLFLDLQWYKSKSCTGNRNRKSKIEKIETEIDSAIAIEFVLNWLNLMSVTGLSSRIDRYIGVCLNGQW